jgi:hypothetical protein
VERRRLLPGVREGRGVQDGVRVTTAAETVVVQVEEKVEIVQ